MPPNRTDRPISPSSDPISPEEKKSREVNQITSESETRRGANSANNGGRPWEDQLVSLICVLFFAVIKKRKLKNAGFHAVIDRARIG